MMVFRRAIIKPWPALVAGALVALAAMGCGSGQQEASPATGPPAATPSPLATLAPSPTINAVGPDVLATIGGLEGVRLLYREFTPELDTVWILDPADPEQRTALSSVRHPHGLGISGALSPDGTRLAYNVLPLGTGNPERDASLWVLDLSDGTSRRLLDRIELGQPPLWSPDQDFLVILRMERGQEQIVSVDLDGNEAVLVEAGGARIFLLGVSSAREVYYVQVATGGDELLAVPAGGGEIRKAVQLAEGRTRNWTLSPEGNRLAYLAQLATTDAGALESRVADIESGEVRPLLQDSGAADHQGIAWTPDGGAVTIGRRLSEGGGAVTISVAGGELTELPGPPSGYDVPGTWSPDGNYLTVTTFAGNVPDVNLLALDGGRFRLGGNTSIAVIGWLK